MNEKFYEAKINYMNTRNRVLLAENEELQEKLTDAEQWNKLLMFILVVIMLLSALGLGASFLNG